MASEFTRKVTGIKTNKAEEYKIDLRDTGDILCEDGEKPELYIGRGKTNHSLTDNVKTINDEPADENNNITQNWTKLPGKPFESLSQNDFEVINDVLNIIVTWSKVTGKPFTSFNLEDFEITNGVVSIKGGTGTSVAWTDVTGKPFITVNTKSGLRTDLNMLSINNAELVIKWSQITEKLFDSIGLGLNNDNNTLKIDTTDDFIFSNSKLSMNPELGKISISLADTSINPFTGIGFTPVNNVAYNVFLTETFVSQITDNLYNNPAIGQIVYYQDKAVVNAVGLDGEYVTGVATYSITSNSWTIQYFNTDNHNDVYLDVFPKDPPMDMPWLKANKCYPVYVSPQFLGAVPGSQYTDYAFGTSALTLDVGGVNFYECYLYLPNENARVIIKFNYSTTEWSYQEL